MKNQDNWKELEQWTESKEKFRLDRDEINMQKKAIIIGIGVLLVITVIIIFSILNPNQISKEIDSIDTK